MPPSETTILREDTYTLYAGIGGVIRPRGDLANILGVPENNVRVVMHDVGGNFGTRGGFNPEFGLSGVGGP